MFSCVSENVVFVVSLFSVSCMVENVILVYPFVEMSKEISLACSSHKRKIEEMLTPLKLQGKEDRG